MAAWLFGSQAEGETTRLSDVDLGILVERGLPQEAASILRNRLSLRVAAIYDVDRCDVVLVDKAPPSLAFEAVQGELLLDRDPDRRIELEAAIMSRYHDRQPKERRWERMTLERMREEGFASETSEA